MPVRWPCRRGRLQPTIAATPRSSEQHGDAGLFCNAAGPISRRNYTRSRRHHADDLVERLGFQQRAGIEERCPAGMWRRRSNPVRRSRETRDGVDVQASGSAPAGFPSCAGNSSVSASAQGEDGVVPGLRGRQEFRSRERRPACRKARRKPACANASAQDALTRLQKRQGLNSPLSPRPKSSPGRSDRRWTRGTRVNEESNGTKNVRKLKEFMPDHLAIPCACFRRPSFRLSCFWAAAPDRSPAGAKPVRPRCRPRRHGTWWSGMSLSPCAPPRRSIQGGSAVDAAASMFFALF